jgi:AcrR family transcriptional regulator
MATGSTHGRGKPGGATPRRATPRPKQPRPRRAGRPAAATGAVLSREAIIEAALDAFAKAGYDAMSIRELTRRFGVSHNLVHHYFRSKAELWRACIDSSFGTLAREIAGALAPGDGTDVLTRLRELFRLFVVLTARYPANGLIITREGALGGPRFDYIFENYVAPNLGPVRAMLAAGQAAGIIRPDLDVRTIFFLLPDGGAGPYTSRPFAKRLDPRDPQRPDVIAAHAELVADVLVRGIATHSVTSRRR